MIAVVDYGLGNLFSVAKAFEFLGEEALITAEPDEIQRAERIVLPGVGAFGDGMHHLKERGLDGVLEEQVQVRHKPFLGICLGMQLLGAKGSEMGEHEGLGWIEGEVKKLDVQPYDLKLPHIGWNDVTLKAESPLFQGIHWEVNPDFYFVHSFQLLCDNPEDRVAVTTYGEEITAAIVKDNIFATQFHPEKSQENGLKILKNFLSWTP